MPLPVMRTTKQTMRKIHSLGYTVSVARVATRWTAIAKDYRTGQSHVSVGDSEERVICDLAARVWSELVLGSKICRFDDPYDREAD